MMITPRPEKHQGILNDFQIADLCRPPVGRLVYRTPFANNIVHAEDVYISEAGAQMLRNIEEARWPNHSVELELYDTAQAAARPVMISPFTEKQVRYIERWYGAEDGGYQKDKIISYGLTSFGYDFRVADEFKIFTNVHSKVADPKEFDQDNYVDFKGDVCTIPPNGFVLARTLERFHMPDDVVGVCVGKSTYARVGIQCLVTPAEPGWEGYLTLEFANLTPTPAKLYANEGGFQMQFFRGQRPQVTYRDRGGKYQGQAAEITLPRT